MNNRVTLDSIIIVSKATNDSAAVADTGQFTIYMDHHPGDEVKVNFMILN